MHSAAFDIRMLILVMLLGTRHCLRLAVQLRTSTCKLSIEPSSLTRPQAVVQTTPPGIHHLKWGLYLIYAIFNAVFVPLVYYLVVETGGRSLEDTDRWFENNPRWLVHKADHSVGRESNGILGKTRGGMAVAEDHQAMMASFAVAADDDYDDDRSSLDSPVTRRSSFPMIE